MTVKWTKQSFDVEVDQSQSVETFQTQIYTLTNVLLVVQQADLGVLQLTHCEHSSDRCVVIVKLFAL